MADPKYANLPGIDLNSPDLFESSDLPEDDQQLSQVTDESTNENVEKVSINTDTAFKAFKGKAVNTGSTDFSDTVGKTRTIGYFSDREEYELVEPGLWKENYQQKFQRIQHEMSELADELVKVKETVKDGCEGKGTSPVKLGKNLEYLQHQLAGLHLEKIVGPEASVDIVDPQGALRQRLIKQLESFGSSTPGDKMKSTTSSASEQYISYELYYRPEEAKFSKNAKLANLEQRLERLENVIGRTYDKTALLTADTDNKSLLGALGNLNSKLSLLEASNTETVEARLNIVIQKMQQVADRREKEPQADPEKQKKILELYEIVKKWEATADSLPQVVDRLMSLKELHEQALQFSQALTFLDTAQQEVKTNLTAHQDMLKQLQSSVINNSKTTQKNIESIERRLKTLI